MKHFLKGVTVTAASLIAMTAITQIIALPVNIVVYVVVAASVLLLFLKKIPAPLIVLIAAVLGFLL
jgi:chromate transporter